MPLESSLIKGYITGDFKVVRHPNTATFLCYEMPFQPLEGITCKYKAYSLQGRTLFEVLKSKSVQDEMRKIVSALANGDGGSLLLGVTDTDAPVVKGIVWDIPSFEELEQLLSEILDGNDHGGDRIWSSVALDQKLAQRHWKVFVHSVTNCEEIRRVLEIRVPQCSGGMFCDMPIGFVINPSGEIFDLRNFVEWKETLLQSFILIVEPKENITVEDHFEKATTAAEQTLQSHFRSDKELIESTGDPSDKLQQMEETHRDKVFRWWAAESGDVISESYRFDHSCAHDLAAQELMMGHR